MLRCGSSCVRFTERIQPLKAWASNMVTWHKGLVSAAEWQPFCPNTGHVSGQTLDKVLLDPLG